MTTSFHLGLSNGTNACGEIEGYRVASASERTCEACKALESWEIRELEKFASGEYRAPEWHAEEWAKGFAKHYCHVSVNDASKIAYTESPEKGALDRQLVVKPGRYLAKHFSLAPHEVSEWAAKHLAANVPPALKIATDSETIVYVYANGPRSCMSGEDAVQAYGAGDLAIAYLEPKDGDVTARAICWPDKQIFGRIYGDENRLALALDVAGYKEASSKAEWRGAKLLKIEVDSGRYVCPWLDIADTVSIGSEFLTVGGGDYSARETSGIIGEPMRRCSNCNDEVSDDDSHYDEHANQELCESCYSERFVCCAGRRCRSDMLYREDAKEFSGRAYCDDCLAEIAFTCEECDELESQDEGCTVDERSLCGSCAREAKQCDNCRELTLEECTETDSGDTFCPNCEDSCAFTCKGCFVVFNGKGSRCDDCTGAIALYVSKLPALYVAPQSTNAAWRGLVPKEQEPLRSKASYPVKAGDLLAVSVGPSDSAWVICEVTHSDALGWPRAIRHHKLGSYRAPLGKALEALGAGATHLDMAKALEAVRSGMTYFDSSQTVGAYLRPFIK